MEWFKGGVVGAIAASRKDKALFIVYVHDDSPASASTSEAWKSDLVQETLSGNQAVAIQIAKGSMEHQQFSQIYPVFIFPSVFCIGLTGKALVIMNGLQSQEDMQEKLREAFQRLREEIEPALPTMPPQATPTQPETPPTQPETPPTQPETPPTKSEEGATTQPSAEPSPLARESESVGVSGEEGEVVSGATGGGGELSLQENREEKLERAQQTIRQRRKKREEADFKKQKEEEMKKREEGRGVGEAKKDLDDLQRQTWIQERKKAKEEEKAAREAIRAKLRQDKLEREAEKRARDQQTAASITDGVVRQRSIPSSPQSSLSALGMCRIQLRLPSGAKSVLEVKSEEQLGTLRTRVSEELEVGEGEFVLSGTYPRKELTEDMDRETLSQLGLAPSGVVVVRFRRGGSMGGKSDGSGGLLWTILQALLNLILALVDLVKGIFGIRKVRDENQQRSEIRSHPPSSGDGRGRPGGTREKRVHRILPGEFEEDSSDDDDDEKRNTYNGNSTEQQ